MTSNLGAGTESIVHGTGGSEAVNDMMRAKARFDAEHFWSVADGPARVVADTQLTDAMLDEGNVVLYGNADTNAAWDRLLGASPIQVHEGYMSFGDSRRDGEDLLAVWIRPLPGDPRGLVMAVGSSGAAACRMSQRLMVTDPTRETADWTLLDGASMGSGKAQQGMFDRQWQLVAD